MGHCFAPVTAAEETLGPTAHKSSVEVVPLLRLQHWWPSPDQDIYTLGTVYLTPTANGVGVGWSAEKNPPTRRKCLRD